MIFEIFKPKDIALIYKVLHLNKKILDDYYKRNFFSVQELDYLETSLNNMLRFLRSLINRCDEPSAKKILEIIDSTEIVMIEKNTCTENNGML